MLGNKNYDKSFHELVPFAVENKKSMDPDHKDDYFFHAEEMEAMTNVTGYPKTDQFKNFDRWPENTWYSHMSEPYNAGTDGRDFHIMLASKFNNKNLIGQVSEAMAGNLVMDQPQSDVPYTLSLSTHYAPIQYKYNLQYLISPAENLALRIVNAADADELTKLIVLAQKLRLDTDVYQAALYVNQYINGVRSDLTTDDVSLDLVNGNKINYYRLAKAEHKDFKTKRHLLANKYVPNYLLSEGGEITLPIDLSRNVQSIDWNHLGEVYFAYDQTLNRLAIAGAIIVIIIIAIAVFIRCVPIEAGVEAAAAIAT